MKFNFLIQSLFIVLITILPSFGIAKDKKNPVTRYVKQLLRNDKEFPPIYKGVLYDDETIADLITVITTTNPIPSIPSVKHIYQSQISLFQVPALAKCKKIIVFDGLQPEYEERIADYKLYQQNIIHLTETDPYFANTQLIFCPNWYHLSGAIKEALKHVKTPFVFIHQHDFVLTKPFDLNRVIASMIANPSIKYVRLAKEFNTSSLWWDGVIDEKIKGIHFVPLCRCFGWSDNDHVTSVSYYTQFVLPACQFGAMEWFLHKNMKEELANCKTSKEADTIHAKFGTYLYGHIQDGYYIHHTDGRLN